MFVRKPLWTIETEDDSGGGTDDTEVQETEDANETESDEDDVSGGQEDADDEAETFDADRALKKIRKANSEARAQRERAKKAEAGAGDAKREAALQRVARRLELPDTAEVDEFLSRLKGETADELADDAERLLSLMAPKKNGTTKPKPRLRGGGDPEEEPDEDIAKVIAGLPRY